MIIGLDFDNSIDKFAHLDLDRTYRGISSYKMILVRFCSEQSGCSWFEDKTAQQARELEAWKQPLAPHLCFIGRHEPLGQAKKVVT